MMHAKFLALLAVAPLALGQDSFDEAMDALSSSLDYSSPTGISGIYPEESPAFPTSSSSTDELDGLLSDLDELSNLDSSTSSSSSSGGIGGLFDNIPSSILSELITAIPTSVIKELQTPASASSYYSELQAGHIPDWVSDLPDDVKEYLETTFETASVSLPTSTSSSSSSSNNDDSSSDSNEHKDAAGILSPSIFASVVGAVGVLGVALAL